MPTVAVVGAVEVKVIVWVPLTVAVAVCCAWAAAFQLLSPPWLASILQAPSVLKVTTPALMLHADDVVASIVKVTVRPDVAVAVGV